MKIRITKELPVAVGDEVRCLESKVFIDGSRHHVGDFFVVKETDLAYFGLFTNGKDYALHSRGTQA